MRTRITLAMLGLLMLPALPAQAQQAPAAEKPDFMQHIAPLLVERCIACHNANQPKGGLDLSSAKGAMAGGTNGPSLVPGKLDESWLLDFVTPSKPGVRPEMPQKGTPLTAAEVEQLKQWIAAGSPWPDGLVLREKAKADLSWWSLQPLSTAEPPAATGMPQSWAAGPIDRFIFAKLAEKGLAPSGPAERRTLIRRVSYDLIGLPPTPEEVDAFVRDERADAYERLIDRLLASPQYGEQWGRHWLDVVRFGESTGFERNVIVDNAWPFRDYVIRSFNEDKPYDQLIVEHLAGDVVARGNPAVEVGTVFLVAGPYDNVGNQDAIATLQIRQNTLDDMIGAVTNAVLGLSVGCARCHDHKFDPIPQEDYYRVQAALAGVSHGNRILEKPEEAAARATARKPLEEARHKLTEEKKTLGKPTPEQGEQLRRLEEIARELGEIEKQLAPLNPPPAVWAGMFHQPGATHLLKGGDPTKKGAQVAPSSLAVRSKVTEKFELPPDTPEGQRRLALARWLVRRDNPLSARVMANRIWQHHFGTGIVETSSDFGYLGSAPSHPELLDWLARRLVQHEWRIKPLHREILLSQAYRQTSALREEAAKVDGGSRLLWRYPPRRLSAEEVRDTLLAITGKLDPKQGGPGFRLYRYVQDNVATYIPLDDPGPETYRRAVYHQNARAARVDLLADFDCPDNAFPAPTRSATTTPLQALTLLNHRFTLDMAGALAERVSRETSAADIGTQVRRAFALALARGPKPAEAEAAQTLAKKHGLPALCRAILNTNELVYID